MLFLTCRGPPSPCFFTWPLLGGCLGWRERPGALWLSLLIRTLLLSDLCSTSWPYLTLIPSQRPHLQIPSCWSLGTQQMNLQNWHEDTFHPAHCNNYQWPSGENASVSLMIGIWGEGEVGRMRVEQVEAHYRVIYSSLYTLSPPYLPPPAWADKRGSSSLPFFPL